MVSDVYGLGIQANGRLSVCPGSPNCVCSAHPDDHDHMIAPLRYEGDAARAIVAMKEVLTALDRAELKSERPDYLHYEVTTKLMRFVDDVELHFVSGVIHVRSASRVGYSDFGVNRRRVEEIRRLWQEKA